MGVSGTEAVGSHRKPLKKCPAVLLFRGFKKALKTLYFSSICSQTRKMYTFGCGFQKKRHQGKQKTHFFLCPCRPSLFSKQRNLIGTHGTDFRSADSSGGRIPETAGGTRSATERMERARTPETKPPQAAK